MIVTFISQCEKKALPRTRKVLDAFANRIGDNTWQTVITEDGLAMVKKLLSATASKSTAVSCYRFHTRKHSELLWIVGNRHKFNEWGWVPVNRTQKDVFMDVMTMKPKQNEVYANTQLQPLVEHSFAVGYLSYQLFQHLIQNDDYRNLAQVAFLAGCLHDLGKLDPEFQTWVRKGKQKDETDDGQHIDAGKFTFEKHPRHNELSLFLYNLFDDGNKKLNRTLKEALKHTIYWHHAKPYRKEQNIGDLKGLYGHLKSNIGQEGIKNFIEQAINTLNKINYLAKDYDNHLSMIEQYLSWEINELSEQIEDSLERNQFPIFKHYEVSDDFEALQGKIRKNAGHNVLRACVISADRLVSALTAQELMEYIAEHRLDELLQKLLNDGSVNLVSHIEQGLEHFPNSERTQKQHEVATKLTQIDDVAVLAGAAGCGKTKIALEWAKLKNAKKIFWVCPRVQVCLGIFKELTEEYLPDANVEIFTGEYKYTNGLDNPTHEYDYLSADVVVTTIDQILSAIVTHTKVNGLIPFLDAHVIFDEYHEYIPMDIFNLLFAELIETKKMRQPEYKNVLLVSATPHYLYLEKVLELNVNHQICEMPSFNPSRYQIEFKTYQDKQKEDNPFYQVYQDKCTFVISNTALLAQLGFIYQKNQENSILLHSKFKRSDQKSLFNEVFDSFNKQGTGKYQILRSGPIVQASLNISCDFMVTEMSNPENILQRIGRLDRFGKNSAVNIIQIAITDDVKNGKCVGSSARFLNKLHSLQSAKVWYDYLTEQLADRAFTLAELYQVYRSFYAMPSIQTWIEQDLQSALNSSIQLLARKVAEPTKVSSAKNTTKKRKISKHSLRGDSRFIQLAKLNVDNYQAPEFLNEYTYTQPLHEQDDYDNLTESLSYIKDIGLIDYLAKKHGRIDPAHPIQPIPDKKHALKMMMLENYSRDADFPLYLSYTQEHLDLINESRNSNAVYYAICEQQAIGSLSLDNLLTLTIDAETQE